MKIVKTNFVLPQYVVEDNYRITLFSSTLVRVEFSVSGVFDEDFPIPVEPQIGSFSVAQHEIVQDKEIFILETENFVLTLKPNRRMLDIGNFEIVVKENVKKEKFLWRPGVKDEQNLGGAMLDLYKYPAGKFYENFTDGLISPNGIFVYRNICEFLWDKQKNWLKRRTEWRFQDWYIFAYGKNYKQAFKDFVLLFGQVPLVPRWVFGYWYSRWYKFTDKEILEVIKKIRNLNIPIDVFVIDTDWRKHGWNGYEWNKEFFPQPQKFLQQLKLLNIKTCLNDHPGYGRSDELPSDDIYKEKIYQRLAEIKEYKIKWDDERYAPFREVMFSYIVFLEFVLYNQ